MPTISSFYGIIIFMYQKGKEHEPPHIHAVTESYHTPFLIQTGEIMAGEFPRKGAHLVREFILEHQDELLEMWETGDYRRIEPLK